MEKIAANKGIGSSRKRKDLNLECNFITPSKLK
jgi:hypothetical protein